MGWCDAMPEKSFVTEVHVNRSSGQLYLCVPKGKGFDVGDEVRVVLLYKKGE